MLNLSMRRYLQVKRYTTVLKSYTLLELYDVWHLIVYAKTWKWSIWRNEYAVLLGGSTVKGLSPQHCTVILFFLFSDGPQRVYPSPNSYRVTLGFWDSLSYLFIIYSIYVPWDPHSIQTYFCSASCRVRKTQQINSHPEN